MEELRAEILEAERSRSDLLKWKLVLVAGLGAIGIGVNPDSGRVPLVLIGIPLVCAYVDLLCRHLTLRVHVIGQFLRSRPPRGAPADVVWKEQLFRSYEDYAYAKQAAFGFENWALFWSSTLLSIAVTGYGVYLWIRQDPWWWGLAVAVSGVLGLVLTFAIERVFEQRKFELGAARYAGPLFKPQGLPPTSG